jgi:site-specific recombinase XerD
MEARENAEWVQRFEAYLKRRFPGRSTAKHYASDLRIFIEYHSGPLTKVAVQDVDAFVDEQRARGLALATVKRRAAALKTFFDFLAEEMGEPDWPNPVSVRRHGGRQPRYLPRDLSDDEVERLLEVVENWRDRAMIGLMLYAGLRVSEVAGLCGVDIIEPEDRDAPIRLRVMGKWRKERVAYLYREGYQPLATHLEEQPLVNPDGPVFRNRFGEPITIGGIQERIQHYAQRSGVAVTCHRLRHTYGRWMAEGEVPVLTLARLLGHNSLQSTQRYIAGADLQVRRSYEVAMERSFSAQAQPTAAETSRPATDTFGSPTVMRETPLAFEDNDWMVEWPSWLRRGCLDWVKHRWYQWKPSQRQHHVDTRLGELRRFWCWQLDRHSWRSWDDLSAADVAAFVEAQLARGLAPRTVVSYLDTLYSVLRYLAGQGRLIKIPPRPAVALPDPLPRHLKAQEVLALETYVAGLAQEAQDHDGLDIALYYLLSHGGLRISEVLDLQVKDLDLAAHQVRVREGKGRRDRMVFLTEKAAQAVARYLETVPHTAEDLVLSQGGQPLDYQQAWRRIRRLGEKAGVQEVHPQRLRHTYATLLLNNGMSIEGLRKLMGHDNLSTTLIYARLADKTIERQYQAAMECATTCQFNSM